MAKVIEMEIKSAIDRYRAQVARYGARVIAVSKTHGPDKIRAAYAAGQRLFGENKVQELVPKHQALPGDIEWHLIGHLQTNKVKLVVPFVEMIHSVDSQKLLNEINKQAKKVNRVVNCLLQVHIASEETKFGFSPEELRQWLATADVSELTHVAVHGLMGMASLTDNMQQVRQEFRGLRQLFEELRTTHLPANMEMKELSMGMSSDYQIALEEGSTLVRIGSAIFGQRVYNT